MLWMMMTLASAGPAEDQAIADEIVTYAKGLDALKGRSIDIKVVDGEVKMTGTVPDLATRNALVAHARSLDGVTAATAGFTVQDGTGVDLSMDLDARAPEAVPEVAVDTESPEEPGLSANEKRLLVSRFKANVMNSEMVGPQGINVRFEGDVLRVDGWVKNKAARNEVERLAEALGVEADVDVQVR